MSLEKDLSDVILPVILQNDFRLWDVKVTKVAKRYVVSISIDKDGGASIDEIAQMSKIIGEILNEYPSLEDSYLLEVGTPGLERSLVRPEHYKYSLNEVATISYRDDTLKRVKGRISNVTDKTVTLHSKTSGNELEEIVIPLETITRAHTVFDFDAAMKKESDLNKITAHDGSEKLKGEIA